MSARAPEDLNQLLGEGVALCGDGRPADALARFERALEIDPDSFQGHNNRGIALLQMDRVAEALDCFNKALAIKPDFARAASNLGSTLNTLGRHDEARAACEQALRIDPAHVDALINLGVALFHLKQDDRALASLAKALELAPGRHDVLSNQGTVLDRLGRYDEALQSYEKALKLKPDYVGALNNQGSVLGKLRRFDEALASYAEAQAISPGEAEAHAREALLRLQMGDYKLGFKKYEWRWLRQGVGAVRKKLEIGARWTGASSIAGKSILLYYEQGLGDAILAARYAPLVASMGARVVLEAPRQIVPLLAGLAGVDTLVAYGDPLPPTDLNCPLLSLPLAFDTDLSSIPASIPYLSLDAASTARWRARLAPGGEFVAGICWRGNPGYRSDSERSIPFDVLAPLLSVPGIRFVSLQKELNADESVLAAKTGMIHPGEDFRNTAEMISALELVITVDTVWAHWAGAIGKRSWVLLPYSPYWVWLTDREDSPWYPTARLFRQKRLGDWREVIQRTAAAIAQLVRQ
jgi:Flp pilus assembly protein TadD